MKNWKDIHTTQDLTKRYASYIPSLQKIAMQHGYALAVHGSMKRDLDLVAIPWVEKPLKPETLVMAIEDAIVGYSHTRNYWKRESHLSNKPHGRRACIIWWAHLADDFNGMSCGGPQRHAMIDLSIMPTQVSKC